MHSSSQRPLRRYAAQLGAALLVGLPLIPATALAAPAQPQVRFSGGGLGMLLCGSKPDVGSIAVTAQSKVIFVNSLGQGATLQIDGETAGAVNNGEAVEVQFHRGPVSVAMVPECLLNLNGDFAPVTVQVNAARTTPRPSARTGQPRPSASAGTGVLGKTGKTKSPAPTAVPGTEASPDMSLEDPILPLEPDAEGGGPDDPGSSPATVVNIDGSPTFQSKSTSTDRGPIGVLAIIATVCVVGVGTGAIRAIISQRASRAEFA